LRAVECTAVEVGLQEARSIFGRSHKTAVGCPIDAKAMEANVASRLARDEPPRDHQLEERRHGAPAELIPGRGVRDHCVRIHKLGQFHPQHSQNGPVHKLLISLPGNGFDDLAQHEEPEVGVTCLRAGGKFQSRVSGQQRAQERSGIRNRLVGQADPLDRDRIGQTGAMAEKMSDRDPSAFEEGRSAVTGG